MSRSSTRKPQSVLGGRKKPQNLPEPALCPRGFGHAAVFAYIYAMKTRLFLLLLLFSPVALAQPRSITVKEFLKLSQNDTTSYVVKGVVSKVRSTTSGSFYLQDNTGTLLVYGLQDPANPGRNFGQMDIVQGDTLSVAGRFTLYAGSTKEMKDGRLLSKADGPDHNLSFNDRLERKPTFKGKEGDAAEAAFVQWVQAHLGTPADGGKGKVKLRFVVGRNGGVQEVQALSGGTAAMREEAVRVVKSSPKWKPAKYDGTEVRVTFFIEVEFK